MIIQHCVPLFIVRHTTANICEAQSRSIGANTVLYCSVLFYITKKQVPLILKMALSKYSRLSLSRLRLSRITFYLEVKSWSMFEHGNLTTCNNLSDLFFPQFCKSDMSRYGYLEVFQSRLDFEIQRVDWRRRFQLAPMIKAVQASPTENQARSCDPYM